MILDTILIGAVVFPTLAVIIWLFENRITHLKCKNILVALLIMTVGLELLGYFGSAHLDPIFRTIPTFVGGLMMFVGNKISMIFVPCVIFGALLNGFVIRLNDMKMPVENGVADLNHILMTELTRLNWLADWIPMQIGNSVSVWSPGDFFIVFGAYLAGFEILLTRSKSSSRR